MPAEITHTIGISGTRDYTSFSTCEAANQRNLVLADEIEIMECYNDGEMTDTLIILGWRTSEVCYVKVYAPIGERHTGNINTGFHVKYNGTVILSYAGNLIVDGLELEVITSSNKYCASLFALEPGTITVTDCLFEATPINTTGIAYWGIQGEGVVSWENTANLTGITTARCIIESTDNSLYVGTTNGKVFKSTNGGVSWTDLGTLTGATTVLCLLESSTGSLYAGTNPNGDVFKSTDGGASWNNTGSLAGVTNVYSLLDAGTAIYAGTSNGLAGGGDVWKTTDGGTTWVNTGNLLNAAVVWCLMRAQSGDIYAGTSPNGDVFKSTDGGTTWTNTGNLSGATIVYSLVETDPDTFYAGTTPNGNVFKTVNGGSSWADTGNLQSITSVFFLFFASNGIIYAGGTGAGASTVYRSTNGGTSWSSTGTLTGSGTCWGIVESYDGFLYAATGATNGDVFKGTPAITGSHICTVANNKFNWFTGDNGLGILCGSQNGDMIVHDNETIMSSDGGEHFIAQDSGQTITIYNESIQIGGASFCSGISWYPNIAPSAPSLTIHDCNITITSTAGLGIYISPNINNFDDVLVNIYDNTIEMNGVEGNPVFEEYLAGIYISNWGGIHTRGFFYIDRNKISQDIANRGEGQGIRTFNEVLEDEIIARNNMIWNFEHGLYWNHNGNVYVYNNSIYNCDYGSLSVIPDVRYVNNVICSFGIDGEFHDFDNDHVSTAANNASRANAMSPYAAPGANSIYSQDPTLIFVSIIAGAVDLHEKEGAATIDAGFDLSADAFWPFSLDYDSDVRAAPWDIGADEFVIIFVEYTVDIDHQAMIYEGYSTDIDHQVMIFESDTLDIDHQVKIIISIVSPGFLVYETEDLEIHDYTNRIENIGIIRRYLDKEFGITQVGNVDVMCENSDKAHTYLHPNGDFYPTSKYIWTWARITCGWGVGLDQNVQHQFQGLVETLELTEARSCNFVIVDVIKELLDGKLATSLTFNQNLVDTTPLESLNPIHIVEYLINEVLGVEVFDFDTESFVAGCDPDSFDDAYADCSTVVVNDTTWPAESSIIEMIQDALKLVQGWIYTGGNGRIKAKVFTNPAPTGLEKHFIGSETDSDRKIMNLRLHPSRRDVINWIKWTYGQAGNPFGPFMDPTSIAQYGYRPLELSTGWEVDTAVLTQVANELTSRYVQPPDMITFTTSNLYGSGDGLDAELGEVIKVTDDGVGIDGLYFRIVEKRDDLLGRKTEIVAEEYVGT